jgi:galactokinase
MGAVAAHFGKTVLRDVPEAEFYDAIPAIRASAGGRAILRAIHFYDDNRRASLEAQALSAGDFDRFLTLVKASGISSSLHLQNTWSLSAPEQQPIPLALALGEQLLQGRGAIRVHGGGFAGTIQAFVPNDAVSAFKDGMESCFGAGSCHILRIRPQGGCVVIP